MPCFHIHLLMYYMQVEKQSIFLMYIVYNLYVEPSFVHNSMLTWEEYAQ